MSARRRTRRIPELAMPLLDRNDWARTLADVVAFEAANPGLAPPPGFSL